MSASCCSVKMMLSGFICGCEALVEQVVEGYGMVLDDVEDGGVEICENLRRGGYKRAFGAVATGEVLRGNDSDGVATVGAHQQDFGMVVGEKGSVDNLNDEAPKLYGLVGGLVVEHEVEARDWPLFLQEEKSAQKFFGYGKGCLPYLGGAGLFKNPLQYVGHL